MLAAHMAMVAYAALAFGYALSVRPGLEAGSRRPRVRPGGARPITVAAGRRLSGSFGLRVRPASFQPVVDPARER